MTLALTLTLTLTLNLTLPLTLTLTQVREVRPLENLLERGRSLLEAAGRGGAEAGAQPQGAEHVAELEVNLALTRTLTPNPDP